MILVFQNTFRQLTDYFSTGGVLMVPLALVSIVMWLLIIDRIFFFRRLYLKNMSARIAWDHVRENRMPDPAVFRGAVSLLVARFLQKRTSRQALDRSILDETVISINTSLNSYLALIGALAAVAPLMGLLGTVTGMIGTFDVLSIYGTGNAKGMAGGISEALVTTQTGLFVAIPGMYMKIFLDRRAQKLKQHIARVGLYLRRHL